MKAYVAIIDTGEDETQRDDVVCVFTDKAKAEAWAKRKNEQIDRVWSMLGCKPNVMDYSFKNVNPYHKKYVLKMIDVNEYKIIETKIR